MKFHKIQRGVCLALFTIAGSYSLYNPHVFQTATLALGGVVMYDLLCYLREKNKPIDHSIKIKELEKIQVELVEKVQSIRDDASLGKLAETFRRK